jgi:TonB family protein
MKKTILLSFFLFVIHAINAQETTIENKVDTDSIYSFVDVMPSYPGGNKDMFSFIAKDIKYPIEALENNIQGKVFVNFYVDIDGSIREPKLLKDIGFGCGVEAIRVIKNMPKWQPGIKNDVLVKVYYTLPVTFKIVDTLGNQIPINNYIENQTIQNKINSIKKPIEIMPSFPGGGAELMKFLAKNTTYPVEARNKGLEGKVVVKFYIDIDGSIKDIKIVKDPVGYGCAEEAIRVIKLMPKWTPGMQDGVPAKVYYTMPVTFKLQ